MKKTTNLTILLCCTMAFGANAQFGKLKSLMGKKEKTEQGKTEEAKAEKTGTDAIAGDQNETSTENVSTNPKAWTVEFDRGIEWFKLAPTGKLIVAASDALYGVDPAAGKIIWKRTEFSKLSTDNYDPIPNSPFVAIVQGGMLSMHHTIIDITDGRIVADTKDLGLKYVTKRYVVPSLNGILFTGSDNKGQLLMMIDVSTGKKLFTLSSIFESNSEMLTAAPLAVDGENIMLATTKRIYKVNTTSGAVVWKADFKTNMDKLSLATEIDDGEDGKESTRDGEKKPDLLGKLPGIGAFSKIGGIGGQMRNASAKLAVSVYGKFILVDKMPGKVYYYNTMGMTAFDLTSGAQIWTPVKFGDPISNFIPEERGFLIATNEKNSDLMLLNYENGQPKWPLVKLSGNITAIRLNGDKLAVASTKSSGTNVVNIVDINSGAPLSNKALKVSGNIKDIQMTNKGLVYRTTRETNIQDVNTGKDLWSSSLSYKEGGGIGVQKGDKTYIWGNNQLYVLDRQSGEYKPIGKGVKFGGDELPQNIELRDNGIFISSEQNMALFDWEGNKTYHVYQKPPGISTFGKIMSITAMTVSMSQSAAHGFQSGASGGQSTTTGRSEMDKADRWGGIGQGALNDLKRRFKATQDAASYQVIQTRVNTGADSGIGLVRVNKDSGKIEAKVVLNDKKPDYIADDIDNLIFYKSENKAITGYHL